MIGTIFLTLFIIGLLIFIIGIGLIVSVVDTNANLKELISSAIKTDKIYTSKEIFDTVGELLIKSPLLMLKSINLIKSEFLDIETLNRIGNLNNTYVRIDGKINSSTTFLSPLTGTETVVTNLQIERSTQNRWKTVYNGKQSEPFSLSDGSGSIDINIKQIDVDDIQWYDNDEMTNTITIMWDSTEKKRNEFWSEYAHAIPFDRDKFEKFVSSGGIKITERLIQNNEQISITGNVVEYADENGWNRELQSKNNKPFQIGVATKEELESIAELKTVQSLIQASVSIMLLSFLGYAVFSITQIML